MLWRRSLILIAAVWLAACGAAPSVTVTPPPATAIAQVSTPTPRPATATRQPSATPSPVPSNTPTATPTSTPTATNTFDPQATVATATPAPAAMCPTADPRAGLLPNFLEPPDYMSMFTAADSYRQQALDYLNAAGPDGLWPVLAAQGQEDGKDFTYTDLTYDGIPEVVLQLGDLNVFGCQSGQYVLLASFVDTSGFYTSPEIGGIADLDRDGSPELIVVYYGCGFACVGGEVLRWTGTVFETMDVPESICLSQVGGTGDGRPYLQVKDIDEDGFMEVLAIGGIPTFGDYINGPWRVETVVCGWNGTFISLRGIYYSAPEYRFQALQDADRALDAGDYPAALAGYQTVINNDVLDWWSPAKKENWSANSQTIWSGDPSPTPLPGDGDLERTQLSAYAYFRLTLLHLLQAQPAEAEASYTTLQSEYPAGSPGHPYAEMGAAFWQAYTADQSVAAGCAAAVAYATAHPDLLIPLGSSYHGWQSPTYTPEMVCPMP